MKAKYGMKKILQIIESKPQKLGALGKFLKQKHSEFTFLEISQGSVRVFC